MIYQVVQMLEQSLLNEAVINGEAEPVYQAERQPKEAATHESVAKADLKVIDSKSA